MGLPVQETRSVRPEPVEGLPFFFFFSGPKEGQGFDRLSPNGVCGHASLFFAAAFAEWR